LRSAYDTLITEAAHIRASNMRNKD